MKKTKLIALLLALILVFVACSKNSDNDTKGEGGNKEGIKAEISVQAEAGWKDYYQTAIDRVLKRNPDSKIEIKETGAFEHIDIIDNTAATNQDVADVFAIPADRFVSLANNQVLAALPAVDMAETLGGFGNIDESLLGYFKVENDYLAFPMNIETLVTFVNTKNAEAAGIDPTKPIELTEVKDPATVLLPLFDAWFGVAPNNAGGIELLAKDGDKFMSTYTSAYSDLNADQKVVFDAIYNYWKLHNESKTPLFDADAGWGYIDEQFTTGGKGVIRLEGPWATSGDGVIAKEAAAGNVTVHPIGQITIAGKPLTQWQGGWALVTNSRIEQDADKMALAVELIKEIVNPEYAVDFYKSTGKILENVTAETYNKSDLSDLDKEVISNTLESYKVSPARPIFKEYGQVWDTWQNAIFSWNTVNPANSEAAYNELKASFNSMMQQITQ